MSNAAVLDTIASYLPALIVRRLAVDGRPIPLPTCEEQPAAVLFADISGFTALTERLAARGSAGAEELTRLLNTYFGQLIDIVTAHGGDVVKFAGDALLAVWQNPGNTLAVLTLRAAQCGLAVQGTLLDYETPEGIRLAVRVAVGAGIVRHLHLGGVLGRCEYLAVGEPFVDVGTANKQVRPEDVVITPHAWQLIGGRCVGAVLPSGDVRLQQVRHALPLVPLDRPRLTAAVEPVVRGYIPAAVRSRLEAGQTGWVGELRQVTVLFVNLPDLNAATTVEKAQAAMCELQQALYHYEGSINKLSVDDKGVTLVAALGLPPLAHENDPVRGVQAALAMHARVRALGGTASVGVTTGRAFCGTYGSPVRREYTLIGKAVNLAARLMQAAAGSILCDEATCRAAQGRIHFETLSPIAVKGRIELVPIFRPLGETVRLAAPSGKPLIGRKAEQQALIDRLHALRDQCKRSGSAASVVVIEGEAGIGKSRLLWALVQQAHAEGVPVLSGAGDALDKSTPYFAWRPVFRSLVRSFLPESRKQRVVESGGAGPESGVYDYATRGLREFLKDDPELARLAPLLGAVLPGEWPQNAITTEMTGEIRADNTNRLLLRLLARMACPAGKLAEPTAAPLLLTLDDCQWLDSASWTLARLAARDVPGLLLVLSTRPLSYPGSGSSARAFSARISRSTLEAPQADPLPVEHSQLLYAPTTSWLRLDVLPPEDTTALVCQRLGVQALPREVAELIYEKAQGNPYFSEELAYALRDTHLIDVAGGECRLASGRPGLRDVALPDTVQGVVTSRIDRLGPAEQLTLKVASVIGRVFSLRLLRDLYPIEDDRAALPAHLHTLKRLDLTRLETPDPDLTYSFKHTITREVVYNLMLVAQRRDLHRAAAEWYERNHAHDLTPLYALLAHHWGQAEVESRAIDYLEKAGAQALDSHANDEAIAFFSEALRIADCRLQIADWKKKKAPDLSASQSAICNLQSAISAERRASWERQLGEAHYAQGSLGPAQDHLERAVALLGCAVPPGGWRRLLASGRQLLRQMLHRVVPVLFVGRAGRLPERRDALLEAARSFEALARIHYLNNARTPCLHAALRALNLAEAAGPSPELARSYANACVVFGLMGLHGVARAHVRRAEETAQGVNQLACSAYVHEVTGLYWYSAGQWEPARAALERAAALAESISDVRRWDEVLVPLAMIPYHHGDFRTSAAIPIQLLASARRRGILQVQCWALSWRLASLLPQGLADAAIAAQAAETLTALEGLLTRTLESADKLVRADLVLGYGVLARARWRRGEIYLAVQAVEKGAAVSASCEPISHYVLEGYAGMLEVATGLWEASQNQERETGNEEERCWALCRALWQFARMHPVGYPQAWLWFGLCAWQSGKRGRARRAWRAALAAAQRLEMPYDAALAHCAIGSHADPGDKPHVLAERREHLDQAREAFIRMDAAHDLARTEAALRGMEDRGQHEQ